MYYHRTVRDRTATVWRRCSVVIDRWRCKPDVEGGSAYYVKFVLKLFFIIWPENLLSGLFAN